MGGWAGCGEVKSYPRPCALRGVHERVEAVCDSSVCCGSFRALTQWIALPLK